MAKGNNKNRKSGSSRKPTKTARRGRGKIDAAVIPAAAAPATRVPKDDPPSKDDCISDPKFVIKSPLDTNDYMVVDLSNGLKVLLISTCNHEMDLGNREINRRTGTFVKVEEFNRRFVNIPDYDSPRIQGGKDCKIEPKKPKKDADWEPPVKKARIEEQPKPKVQPPSPVSICLGIGAGSVHNPEDIPGMAHICEHACASFGSTKYPAVSTIFHEVQRLHGHFNACTIDENTLYSIQMDLNAAGTAGFERILDILSDAIQNPLLPADKVEREIFAVDCEFGLREYHDVSRMWHLLCSTTDPKHPFGRFSCGNAAAFQGDDLHKRIADWKERHYAANYMTLTVQAALPLNDLKESVEKYFINLKRSDLPSPMDELLKKHRNPFATKRFNKLYKVYPIADHQIMAITWTLPAKFAQNFKTKPISYLSSFFSNGSSLMEYLRKKHWAYAIKASSPFGAGQNAFSSVFSVLIELTTEGVHEMLKVVPTVYSYLKMILDSKPEERIFNDLRRENADTFHYGRNHSPIQDWTDLFDLTCSLRKLDPKYILTSRTLMTDFDPELIEECIKGLTPENMNVMVCSKTFKGVCRTVEPWYKTDYASCDLDDDLRRKCKHPAKIPDFQLPKENSFKQRNILCQVASSGTLELGPGLPSLLLKNNKASAVYWKLNFCSPGKAPTGVYNLFIANPTINQTSIGTGLLEIWLGMMQDHLRKTLHQVKKSRVQATAMAIGGNAIMMSLKGPPANHTRILKTLLDTFNSFEKLADPESFKDFKDYFRKTCFNVTLNSEIFALDLHDYLLKENHSLFDHMKAAIENSTYEDFGNFIRGFKSKMFVQAAMVGCVAEPSAREVAGLIEGMKYRELPEIFSTPVSRAMQLPLGEHCLRVKSRNELDQTSRVVNLYQFGNLGAIEKCLMIRLARIMSIHAFVQLRNNENLSYVVQVSPCAHSGALGIRFQVSPQPHRHTTGYVDERIDSFLESFHKKFGNYDEFFKAGGNRSCTREQHEMMLQMYNDHLLPEGKYFRKLSIQVVGSYDKDKVKDAPKQPTGENNKTEKYGKGLESDDDRNCSEKIFSELDINYDVPEDCEGKNGYFIIDLEAFKNSLYCFPRQ